MTTTDIHTVDLPPTVAELLANAGRDRVNMIVAFTDADGRSVFGYRGSTHLQSGSRLGTWLRAKQGSLQTHVRDGAEVEVIYRNPRAQAYYRLTGYARLVDDVDESDKIYAGAPPHEQQADPTKAGCAMIVDITRVAGRDRTGELVPMSAGAV